MIELGVINALKNKGISDADMHGFNDFASDINNIENSYSATDEGKVVQNNTLVPQTSTNITLNGQYDTTINNQINVNVPNTFEVEDEGKVVNNGSLIAQTSTTITENGTYDTTVNNNITVNVFTGHNAPILSKGVPVDLYPVSITDREFGLEKHGMVLLQIYPLLICGLTVSMYILPIIIIIIIIIMF